VRVTASVLTGKLKNGRTLLTTHTEGGHGPSSGLLKASSNEGR